MDRRFEPLISECKKIEKYSLWNATTYFEAASCYRKAHYGMSSIPILLGALGGWKPLTDPSLASEGTILLAGFAALLAGIVGSLISLWNLDRVYVDHNKAGTRYKTLENEARRAYEVWVHDEHYEAFKERVSNLTKRYDKLGEETVLTSSRAYKKAQRKIEKEYLTVTDGKSPTHT